MLKVKGSNLFALALALAVSFSSPGCSVQAAASRRGDGLCLARKGTAQAKIVVASAAAIPAEKTAAKELSDYLGKITGAAFETVEEKDLPAGAPAIYVGQTQFAAAHGIDGAKLGAEESILRTADGSLILAGGRPRGTLYAVYELLETHLGVRWYTTWAEKVPRTATCSIPPMDRRVKPYMMFRSHYTHLSGDGWKMFNARNRINEPSSSWLDESVGGGVAYGGRIYGGHGFAPYVPADKYFKDHPEYFSLRGGKRVPSNGLDGNHLCLTHPDVLRIIIEEVKKDIRQGPDGLCYTVAVNDGGSQTLCDCPKCREVAKQYGGSDEPYTDSGLLLWFVNQVADSIKDESPSKFIRTLAYGPASKTPKNIRARDNVIVHVCAGPRSEAVYLPMGARSFELKNLREWGNYTRHIWVWDYAGACYHQPAFFRPITWKMDEQYKFFKTVPAIDGVFQENEIFMYEDSMFTQFYEMNMWINMRLSRDPDADVNALAADFVNGFYGRAGPEILKYLDLVRARLPAFPFRTFDYAFMKESQRCFDRAERAVRRDPEMLGRVKDLRIQLDLAALVWRNDIVRDYLAQGGTLEKYPWRIPMLKARVIDTLDRTTHPYLLKPKLKHRMADGVEREIVRLDIAREYVNEVSAGVDYTPLPKELAALPPDRVIDLPAPLIAERNFPLFAADPEATLGLAVPRMNTNDCPMYVCYYSSVPGDSRGGGTTIKAGDVPGRGYHLYKSPPFPLNEWTFIYLTSSWRIQRHLYTLYDPAHPKQMWEAYVSMKYTGPAYPFGKPDEPNGLFIDRLILVRGEEPQVEPGKKP